MANPLLAAGFRRFRTQAMRAVNFAASRHAPRPERCIFMAYPLLAAGFGRFADACGCFANAPHAPDPQPLNENPSAAHSGTRWSSADSNRVRLLGFMAAQALWTLSVLPSVRSSIPLDDEYSGNLPCFRQHSHVRLASADVWQSAGVSSGQDLDSPGTVVGNVYSSRTPICMSVYLTLYGAVTHQFVRAFM